MQELNLGWRCQLLSPDVMEVRVRSEADPTPCPFFCCAAVLSLSTCSSFALAWCAKVLTSFMMSCSTAAVAHVCTRVGATALGAPWLLLTQ
jgi:hypothetical protein